VKHTIGRAAARRNTPKQPRAIRAGPHEAGTTNWGPNTGGLPDFFNTRGLSDFCKTGHLSDLLSNTGVDLIFHQKSGGLS